MGLTATDIGRRINASPEVVNHLLVDAGLQTGKPGGYILTDLGKAFGDAVERENGYGGYARREWWWNTWGRKRHREARRHAREDRRDD